MRYLYSFLLYLTLPFLFIRLWWKARRVPGYSERRWERLGFYPFKLEKSLWIHAVSVGETLAAIPLIKALQAQYPDLPIVMTTMTPTGAKQVQKSLGDSVRHAYIPYDLPDAMQRFIRTMHPVAGLIMETELWPNMLAVCAKNQIPICLLNARLSEKSARGYARIAKMTRTMLQQIAGIAAHGDADAKRFIALGADPKKVQVSGNIKFDLVIPPDLAEKSKMLRTSLGINRFIWIAASTHAGEDEIILAAHQRLLTKNSRALLILVPRHPDRFNDVYTLCADNFIVARRSLNEDVTEHTQVYLGDSMGELLLMYAVSNVAFVGGSLIESGGHNILEPAALSLPILTGPSLYNFAEIRDLFLTAQALIQVTDELTLTDMLSQLMESPAKAVQMGARANLVVAANRGALTRQLRMVDEVLKS